MAKFFGMLKKPNQIMWLDAILLGVGGAAHLLPDVLAPITGFALGPVTVLMLVGGLSVARVIDMFIK